MPNRYRLKGSTLAEIRQKAELQYGPSARIVSAERVISPGIAGLFAGDHFEALVEVGPPDETISGEVIPDAGLLAGDADNAVPAFRPAARPASRPAARPASRFSRAAAAPKPPVTLAGARPAPSSTLQDRPEIPAARSHQLQGAAIAALLEEADAADRGPHDERPDDQRAHSQRAHDQRAHGQRPAGVSTASPDFAELLEQLGAGLQPVPVSEPEPSFVNATGGSASAAPPAAPAAKIPAPAPRTGVGDLVLLVGLGDDAMDTALTMSTAAGGADVRTGGALSAYGHLHVDGRQGATAARAHAVLTDRTVLVAYGLNRAREAAEKPKELAALAADQIWLVVDAGRKHEDTARWVNALASELPVTAIAIVGAAETGTPESVNGLGLPVGWIDNRQARSGQL